MPSHRREPDAEPVSLRRLSRVVGTAAAGWTPAQEPAVDVAPPAGHGLLLTASRPALAWLIVAGLAVLVVSGFLLSRHHPASAEAPPGPSTVAPPVAVA